MINKHKNRGVSYLEIIIAVAIIAFVVMGFARLFLAHNVSVTGSRMRTLASNWAADSMEELKRSYYSDVSTGSWASASQQLGGVNEFTREINVAEIDDGLKEIEILVSWQEMGDTRTLRIASFMADY